MRTREYLEATVKPANGFAGREWEITIIGAESPDKIISIGGQEFVPSKNGRLYSTDALAHSAPMWEGVEVYDNHLTDREFQEKQGMRSPLKEWVGTIVQPRWDASQRKLVAILKVVEEALGKKLKAAYDHDVLRTIGLSIDTNPIESQVMYEGRMIPAIVGFKDITSVDVVARPAAGGGFNRLIAAVISKESDMEKEEVLEMFNQVLEEKLPGLIEQQVKSITTEALAVEEDEPDLDNLSDEEVQEALAKKNAAKAQLEAEKAEKKAREARREVDLARTELMLTRKLEKARLPDKFEAAVLAQFEGRIVDAADIDAAIKNMKEAHASMDPTGRVRANGDHNIQVGLMDDDRFALEFARLMMGNESFRQLEHAKDEGVVQRIKEAGAYKSWLNAGKPDLPYYPRMSHLLYEYLGGHPMFDQRAMEMATTSTLTTVVKNTVNIMTANSYSMRERWFEPIVTIEEVDTIDQTTLARVYGVNTLSTVTEGQPYTELTLADEEETAAFVKRGNYIGISIETLMSDKLNYVRRIPTVLADSWFNTQSALVSNVFTVNSAAGPVLGTTGALFNATATTTAGGHKNLLTTALSHAQFSTCRTEMRKQTDQPLGAGRRLLLTPKYLLVPVDLEVTALDIRNSELVPEADFSSTTGNQTINQFRNSFEVVVVPDWTDTDNWALVADPNIAPAIWLIYPRGQRTPSIFSADSEQSGAMFTNDELRFKVRLMTYRFSATYDCAPVSDFRPLHKSNV